MQHIFCKAPAQGSETLAKILDAYRADPEFARELADDCLTKCEACLGVYRNLKKNKDFEKRRILHNFRPDKIYDWQLLKDKKIRTAFILAGDDPETRRGFKAFFLMLYSTIPTDNIKIDLSDTAFTEAEKNFFLDDEIPRNQRFMVALNCYISQEGSLLSEEYARILIDAYNDASSSADMCDMKLLILCCIFSLVRRECPFVCLFHETLLDAAKLRETRKLMLENIQALGKLKLLQYFFNNLSEFPVYVLDHFISSVAQLDIREVFLANEATDALVVAANRHCAWLMRDYAHNNALMAFFKGLAFAKLCFLRTNHMRLQSSIFDNDWQKFDGQAFPLLYLEIFAGTPVSVNRALGGEVGILGSIIGNKELPSAMYSQQQLAGIIKDIGCIAGCGYAIGWLGLRISRLFEISCTTAVEFTRVFSTYDKLDSLVIDEGLVDMLDLARKRRRPALICEIYRKAIRDGLPRGIIDTIGEYIEDAFNGDEGTPEILSGGASSESPVIFENDDSSVHPKTDRIMVKIPAKGKEDRMLKIVLKRKDGHSASNDGCELGTDNENKNENNGIGEIQRKKSRVVQPDTESTGPDSDINILRLSSDSMDDKVQPSQDCKAINKRSEGSYLVFDGHITGVDDRNTKSNYLVFDNQITVIGDEHKAANKSLKPPASGSRSLERMPVRSGAYASCYNKAPLPLVKMATRPVSDVPDMSENVFSKNIQRQNASKQPDMEDDVIVVFDSTDKKPSDGRSSPLDNLEHIIKAASEINNVAKERESIFIDYKRMLNRTNAIPKKILESNGVAREQETDFIKCKEVPNGATAVQNKGLRAENGPAENKRAAIEAVELETLLKNSSDRSFFSEFLGLCSRASTPFRKPGSFFGSYEEYYAFFNSLRLEEIRASVVQSTYRANHAHACVVWGTSQPLEMRCEAFLYSEYSLVLFTDRWISHASAADLVAGQLDAGARCADLPAGTAFFLGMVVGIENDTDPNKVRNKCALSIITSKATPPLCIGQQLYFRCIDNMTTVLREFYALKSIESSTLLKWILKPSLYGAGVASNLTEKTASPICQELNETQMDVVRRCLGSQEKFFLIQGPPGTGKTRVVLAIIAGLLGDANAPRKVLVCTPSNTAIDEIVLRLAACYGGQPDDCGQDQPFVRIGIAASRDVEPYTLEYQASRKKLFNKHKSRQAVIARASIVCSTLNSSAIACIGDFAFDYLIVDEACQATELSMLVPLKYDFKKIVLIGDPMQLPPTVFSRNRALEYSLFERFSGAFRPALLNTQYRMHKSICSISSKLFYSGRLITAPERLRGDGIAARYRFRPTYFINISMGNERTDSAKSYYNPVEARVALKIHGYLAGKYGDTLRISILSPYKAQVAYIKDLGTSEHNVNTIDAFQGKESDVVILSTVRQSGLGFTCDFRRINVAITRPRLCIIVLGAYACLQQNRMWKSIIDMMQGDSRFSERTMPDFLNTL